MKKALIVDDSLMMREIYSSYLQNAVFYTIEKVCSVEEAQDTLAS